LKRQRFVEIILALILKKAKLKTVCTIKNSNNIRLTVISGKIQLSRSQKPLVHLPIKLNQMPGHPNKQLQYGTIKLLPQLQPKIYC
jgi:hypothetical protein